jgi:TolA-binding protein
MDNIVHFQARDTVKNLTREKSEMEAELVTVRLKMEEFRTRETNLTKGIDQLQLKVAELKQMEEQLRRELQNEKVALEQAQKENADLRKSLDRYLVLLSIKYSYLKYCFFSRTLIEKEIELDGKNKPIADLANLKLARDNRLKEQAESKTTEAEAAVAVLRCQLEESVKQKEEMEQVVVFFCTFIAAGSFSPSKSE